MEGDTLVGNWNVLKDDKGKVISTGFCDFKIPSGWSMDTYDTPQDGITPEPKVDNDLVSAKAKLKVLGLTDAELKAMGL